MRFLRTTRCEQCSQEIQVPRVGSYHVQCDACGKLNSRRLPFLPGSGSKAREDRNAFEERARTLRREAAAERMARRAAGELPIASGSGFQKPKEVGISTPLPKAAPPKVEPPKPTPPAEEPPKDSSKAVTPFPEWNPKMLRADLLEIATGLGLDVSTKSTKKDITNALQAAQDAHES